MKGSAEIFLAALDAIREPLFVLSDGGRLIFANKAFWIAIRSDSQPPVETESKSPWFWPQLANTELKAEPFTTVFICPDGKESTVHLRAIALEGGNHLIQLLEGLQGAEPNRDFHAQRLQTLGMLASGVAHDFNNILTGILGHVAYLKAAAKLEGQPFESLLSVEEGSKKASDIVQQILQFSKIETSERLKTINLSQLVERTCRLLRGAISAKYQLEVKNIQPNEISVLGIESKITQILVNLVVNARDACEKTGSIVVTIDEIKDNERMAAILATDELPCDSYAVLRVEDSGHGMAPEVLERIFEPYFSTKAERGTGIGLYTVLTIVKGFGGAIEVESAPDRGTSISIYLPQLLAEQVTAPSVSRSAAQVRPAKGGSILIVDDEYSVRNVLLLALQHLGYQVEAVSSGSEALVKYGAGGNKYDLVLLDMLMPQMSGEKTYFSLKELDPGVKVLLISGFASEEAIKSVLEGGGLGFIQKPFTIEVLAQRIREVLG